MNLDALKQLTTQELVAIHEAAGKLVEERMSNAIKRFLEILVEKKIDAKLPRTEPDSAIIVCMTIAGWDNVQVLVADQKLIPPLGVAGLNPKVEIAYLEGNRYKFEVQLQDWPEGWGFFQDMDDDFLGPEEALECHFSLTGNITE